MDYFMLSLKNYWNFEGRARRMEYWLFQLFYSLICIPVLAFDMIMAYYMGYEQRYYLTIIYAVLLFIPHVAVSVRRLHDTNNSGWMLLLSFVPVIGVIWLLILNLTEGNYGTNAYGRNPKNILNRS